MRLFEIEAAQQAAKQRIKQLKANAARAKDNASRMKAQADASADQLALKQSRQAMREVESRGAGTGCGYAGVDRNSDDVGRPKVDEVADMRIFRCTVRVAHASGSGTMVVWAHVAASNSINARSQLQAQYGKGNVIGVPTLTE